MTRSPSGVTLTATRNRGLGAGPAMTSPLMLKLDPWQGQRDRDSAANQLGVQPRCVQRDQMAYTPLSSRTTQTRWSLRMVTPRGRSFTLPSLKRWEGSYKTLGNMKRAVAAALEARKATKAAQAPAINPRRVTSMVKGAG